VVGDRTTSLHVLSLCEPIERRMMTLNRKREIRGSAPPFEGNRFGMLFMM
jgi:hypothetical protein